MKTNVFYVNGIIPVICATMLARIKFPGCFNVLVVENINVSIFPRIFLKNNNKAIIDLFLPLFNWDKVVKIESSMLFVSLEFGLLIKLFPKLKGFRIFKSLKKTKLDVENALKILKPQDELFVSDNSYMWRFWYRGQCDVNFIEHGASTYKMKFVSSGYKSFLKRIIFAINGYNYNVIPKSVFLTDACKSWKSATLQDNKECSNIVSIDISDHINYLFHIFEEGYKAKFKNEYQELLDLRKILRGKDHCIYIPISSPSRIESERYFSKQIKKVNVNNLFFVIKFHSRNGNRFDDFYKKYINNVYFIKSPMNRSLPAEFLLYFLEDSRLFGTYSSAHLYSNWWLNRETYLVTADDDEFNSLLLSEYEGVLKDFERFIDDCQFLGVR